MNPYLVVWTREAEDALALVWLYSTNRSALTLASELAERLLGRDPHTYGEVVAEGLYAISVPPIRLYFEVDVQARSVTVTNVCQLV
jgi:hypothetical protein